MPDGTFNAAIKPEEGLNAEIGYRYTAPNTKTHAEATIYTMYMENLLVTKRETEDVFYGTNAGSTRHHGLELNTSHVIDWTLSKTLKLSASYFQSLNRFKTFIDDGIDYSDKYLPGIPAFNLNTSALLIINKWQLNINYSYIGQQYLNDSNTKSYQGFGKAGAKLSRHFNTKILRGTIHLGADNLFNTHYASMVLINAPSFGNNLPRYYYPGLPFNVFGGVSLNIK